MTTPSNSIKNIVPNGNLTNDATGWSLSSVNRLEGGGFAFQPNSTAMAAVTQGIPKPKAGLWTCVVPPTLDGEYVADLYAEDEAGNVSYLATVLFTVDSKNLVFSVKWLKWRVELESRDFKMELYSSCKER